MRHNLKEANWIQLARRPLRSIRSFKLTAAFTDAYSCFIVYKWPVSVSMPHVLTDILCQITAGLDHRQPVQHVVTSLATSAFTHSEVTAGRDFSASVSHVLVYALLAASVFLRYVTCRFCSVRKMRSMTSLLTWEFTVEPFLAICCVWGIFLLGLNDLLLQLHNVNSCSCVF